jgi:acyl-CoA synthetase (NDP forming)
VLAALLRARRFRLGAGTQRVSANLTAHAGEIAADAAPWIGAARPPADAPSVSLGDHPGTLGPKSFGFLNNVGGIAALDAPVPALPRKGGLALVVPRRDALPDLVPLALARGLGLSWIVSVGDGDPAEALAFVGADAATHGIALVLGDGADGATLRQVLGLKPTVVWGGDAVCRAVARRAGAQVADGVDQWLARAALLDAQVHTGARVSVVVVGGGAGFVQREVEAAGLDATVKAVDEREPAELRDAVTSALAEQRPLVLVAGATPVTLPELEHLQVVSADLRHPEHLRALLHALAAPAAEAAPVEEAAKKPKVDATLLERVRSELDHDGRELNDHDAKRLLKAYGARVTRQAPTNTPTGAANLAKVIGMPVLLIAGELIRVAESLPDVRRIATLMLQAQANEKLPSVTVRERFPEAPRAQVTTVVEKGLGLTLQIGESCALLPLTRADAVALAAATPARRSADQKAVATLLERISACADAERALLDLEIYCGAEPCVLEASGELRK